LWIFTVFFVHSKNQQKLFKEISERNFQENLTKRLGMPRNVFGILGILCVHACAVNVNLELLQSFYFSSWKLLNFTYQNPARTLWVVQIILECFLPAAYFWRIWVAEFNVTGHLFIGTLSMHVLNRNGNVSSVEFVTAHAWKGVALRLGFQPRI